MASITPSLKHTLIGAAACLAPTACYTGTDMAGDASGFRQVLFPSPAVAFGYDDRIDFNSQIDFAEAGLTPAQAELYESEGCIPHSALLGDANAFEMWFDLWYGDGHSFIVPKGASLMVEVTVCDDPVIDPQLEPERYASPAGGTSRPGLRLAATYRPVDGNGQPTGRRPRLDIALTTPDGTSVTLKSSFDVSAEGTTWERTRILDNTMTGPGSKNVQLQEFYPIWEQSGTYILTLTNSGRTDVQVRRFLYELWYAHGSPDEFAR